MGTLGPITSCETCGAMLHTKDAELHEGWHRRLEGTQPPRWFAEGRDPPPNTRVGGVMSPD